VRREVHIGRLTSSEAGKVGERSVRADTLLEADLPEQVQVLTPFAGGGDGLYFPSPSGATCALEVEERAVEEVAARVLGFLFNAKNPIPSECASNPAHRGALKLGENVLLLDRTLQLLALISGKVRLGEEDASHPVLRGDTFNAELVKYLQAEAIWVQAILMNSTANKLQFGALELAATGVLAPLAPAFKLLKEAWQTQETAAGTYLAAVNALLAAKDTWLSTKVNTE